MEKCILYCDHWQNGGVESYLMNQLRNWDLSKIECLIVTAEKTTDVYDQELRKMNVQQYVLLEGECSFPILRILKTFYTFKIFLQEHSCDILYLNLTNSVTMRYALIAKRLGVSRRIVHSHNSGLEPSLTKTIKLFAHIISKNIYAYAATDWWACSNIAACFLFPQSIYKKVVYIPNAIRVDDFSFSAKKRKQIRCEWNIYDDDIKIVGTVGRCTTQKNHSFLLDVFAATYTQYPKMKLLIVGDGVMRPKLEEKAQNLGIIDKCIFHGFTDNVAPLYSAMDVFCLPSVVEGFGTVAIEAQTAGCKCLLSEAVSKQAKILIETQYLPLDRKEWVDNLLTVLQEPFDNRMRLMAAEQVRKKGFDTVDNARRTQDLLIGIDDNGVSLS